MGPPPPPRFKFSVDAETIDTRQMLMDEWDRDFERATKSLPPFSRLYVAPPPSDVENNPDWLKVQTHGLPTVWIEKESRHCTRLVNSVQHCHCRMCVP